jgi:tetratricopeptide (TPR) repeat protein
MSEQIMTRASTMGPRKTDRSNPRLARLTLAMVVALPVWSHRALSWAQAPGAAPAGAPAAPAGRKRRQPPPAVIPVAETAAAQKLYSSGNYEGAVAQAKAALTKNEKYTPAMLVMAKSYYKLKKYEWVRHLDKMMQANNAPEGEKAEMYHLLAWMEIEKKNTPGAIEMLKKATDARAENPVLWNNLGAQYLEAKNYKEAAPALEKATQLNPTFAKAFLNLGSAYRGLKEYDKAQASYQKALQLFPNYADAVFHMGILYLDAEKVPNMDTIAKLNTAIGHFQRYRQMMGGLLRPTDPVDTYMAEARDKIDKEQKRIERQKKQEERDRQRQTQKAAPAAGAPAGGAPPGGAAPGGAPPAGKKPPGDAPLPPSQ